MRLPDLLREEEIVDGVGGAGEGALTLTKISYKRMSLSTESPAILKDGRLPMWRASGS